jgi:hypothetical protein
VTYLPAPYESAQQDDLAAALGAGLTVATAGITSWVLGTFAVEVVSSVFRETKDGNFSFDGVPADLVVPTVGWSIAVVFLVLGAVLMLFRRGRGTVIVGALIAVATTAIAQFAYHYDDLVTAPAPATVHLDKWWLYWGGVAVFVAAILPATGRWVNRGRRKPPTGTATPGGSGYVTGMTTTDLTTGWPTG